MQFNEHQSRLWHNMIQSIEDFRKGELLFFDLVYDLEGTLDACEFKDQKLVEQWYNYWTPLEILYTTKGNSVTIEEANKYLFDMEAFLKRKFIE